MVFLFKTQNKTSQTKSPKGLLRQIADESIEAFKDTGKDVVRGVTRLPKELLLGIQAEEKGLSGEKERRKPEIAEKEGGSTKLDLEAMFKNSDEKRQAEVRRRLEAVLHQRYIRPSGASEYGQELARKQEQQQKPVYYQVWEEQQEKKKQAEKAEKQGSGLPVISTMRKRGDWMRGLKRKKTASPQQLNRAEFKGGKGKS